MAIGGGWLGGVVRRGEIDDWFGSTRIVVLSGIAFCGLLYSFRRWSRYFTQTPHLDREHRPSMVAGAPLSFLMGILMTRALAVLPAFLPSRRRHSANPVGCLLLIS